MGTDAADDSANQSGAEPVYGPAFGSVQSRTPAAEANPLRRSLADAPAPPYTAPYPPYPSDVPQPAALSVPVASGLAYFTIVPAIVFLLTEPYRTNAQVRFHSWQSIFYFLAVAAVRVLDMLLVSMLPAALAFYANSLLYLVLMAGWLIATIHAFQGSRWLLPVVGSYAEQTANTVSTR